MSAHPDPPPSFRVLITLVSYAWCRIHSVKHDPIYFGREPRHRFDAPAKEFGALYVAKDFHGAFIETFGHSTGVRFVTTAELRLRGLALITPKRKLRLVDLRAQGLARMGADAELTSGPDRDLALVPLGGALTPTRSTRRYASQRDGSPAVPTRKLRRRSTRSWAS